MKGFPEMLSSKFDYLYVKENFPVEKWVGEFQALLDSRLCWTVVGPVSGPDAGVTDQTHKVGLMNAGDVDSYCQLELVEDQRAKIFRIGFTAAEVQAIINGAQ